MLLAALVDGFAEFLEQVFLLAGQMHRRFDHHAAQQRHEPVEAFETGLCGLGAHGRRGFSFAGEGGKHHGGKVGSGWTVSGPVADDVLGLRHVEQAGAGCGSNWAKLDLNRVTWVAAADFEIGVVA